MRGRGPRWNRFKASMRSMFSRFKPIAKNVAKDTLMPIGKDLMFMKKPSADSVAKHFGSALRANLLKEMPA